VALWTFLTPVFGLAFSAVLLDELPGGREITGIALVLAGLGGGLAWPAGREHSGDQRLRHVRRSGRTPSNQGTAVEST
jgi:hypothetical protein